MDLIINITIELFQPVGNFFSKRILPKGLVEEDSILSTFLGFLIVITLVVILGFILIKLSSS